MKQVELPLASSIPDSAACTILLYFCEQARLMTNYMNCNLILITHIICGMDNGKRTSCAVQYISSNLYSSANASLHFFSSQLHSLLKCSEK